MSSRVSVHVYTKVNKTGVLLSLNLNKAYVLLSFICFHSFQQRNQQDNFPHGSPYGNSTEF